MKHHIRVYNRVSKFFDLLVISLFIILTVILLFNVGIDFYSGFRHGFTIHEIIDIVSKILIATTIKDIIDKEIDHYKGKQLDLVVFFEFLIATISREMLILLAKNRWMDIIFACISSVLLIFIWQLLSKKK